ncbi:helix-turn-helix domain-containing protein [Kaistella rhinocerotis]|uniref:helix-turn-helix domain-containing protein n=1 Tax=Kaistella rhinocerotis TaxID=3026437 RepID=UPI0025558295|nr:helix-turn-helix transcriptional regulator [Kaistella sp. Ran72]
MDIKLRFAAKVKELRAASGMSQEVLANAAGLDRTYLQSIEKGKRNVSLETVEKLAMAFNIEIKDFFK